MSNYVLDDQENEIQYITFGAISQDPEEGRFGRYRGLCGGNYYNGSLQFLQSEKKIKLISLVKMGFKMPDIKEIFKEVETARDVDDDRVTQILVEMLDFNFTAENSFTTSTDEMIVFYTAGAVVRGLKSKTKCASCCDMLARGKMMSMEDDEAIENESEREKLVDMVNRGGLHKPTDLMYMTCIHAWNLYKYMQTDEKLFMKMMSAKNAREVFVSVFMHFIAEGTCTKVIYQHKCAAGCAFSDKLKKIAAATFNIKVKNFVKEENDKIHEAKTKKKRTTADPKTSSTARKIKKLSG
jgi:hypothetical protein